MHEIPLERFIATMRENTDDEMRYCFIIGAGASRESGIKTGIEMAREWMGELLDSYSGEQIEAMMRDLGIDPFPYDNISSEHYFDVFDLRFHANYRHGYIALEKSMDRARPSYGYYTFATMLATTGHNLVITTNFDSLVEDALFLCSERKPVVVDHELLAEYLDFNKKRPIIAKINRGLFYEPLNRRAELQNLMDGWKDVLRTAFRIYTPVVIGYAGGDGSLMRFLNDLSIRLNGLYWCYYAPHGPSPEVRALVRRRKGYLIPIDGFDDMMYRMETGLSIKNPKENMVSAANERLGEYEKSYTAFVKKYRSAENPTERQIELLASMDDASERAVRELTARIAGAPDEARLYSDRAMAFERLGKHAEAADDYARAAELDPDDADTHNNLGNALSELGSYGPALESYGDAIALDPDVPDFYNNRGLAYYELGRYPEAVADYSEAIALAPDFAVAYRHRAWAYEATGDAERARADYERANLLRLEN